MKLKKLGMIYAKCAAISAKNYMFPSEEYSRALTLDEKLKIYKKYNIDGFLFHYCPMVALQSIIKNQQIRYTNIANLKDKTEFVHAIELLKEILNENNLQLPKELIEYLNDGDVMKKLQDRQQNYPIRGLENMNEKTYRSDYQETMCNVYTCSLSENHDTEYMWDNYTVSREEKGKGACIEFLTLNDYIIKDRNMTDRNTPNDNYKMIFLWGRVLYDDEEKKKIICKLLMDIQEVYNLIIQDSDIDVASRKNFVQSTLVRGMNNIRIFMKKKEDDKSQYFLEQEYRGVAIIPVRSTESNDLPPNYTIGSHYVDIPFQSKAFNRLLISCEVEGGYEKWRQCIKEELEVYGMKQVEIYEYCDVAKT